MSSRVVIIGAGFGGLGAAHNLVGSTCDVTIVDSKDWFTIGGTWQYAWSGRVSKEATTWPLEDAKEALKGIDMRLNTEVASLDLAGKAVVLKDGTSVPYDHLVLSPGVVGDPSTIEGMSDALDMYSYTDVARQEKELAEIVSKAKAGEKQTLCIAIGAAPYKCPVAPFEVAFIADDVFKREGCRDNVRIVVTSPVPWPLPDSAKSVFEKLIAEKNVDFMPNAPVAAVENVGTQLRFADGTTLEANKVWAVYPQTAPKFVKDAGITNPKGFVPVDVSTNRVATAEGVYCIGDCCGISVGGKPHPKAGEFAWQMGEMVANLIRQTEGYEHIRLGACIAECGGGGGVLVAPDYTDVVRDPEGGKPRCDVADKKSPDGEEAKLAWVNKYVGRIFGDRGRKFVPQDAAAVTA